MNLTQYFATVPAPSETALAAAKERQLQLTKPAGALARLEEIGNWIAACQDQVPPRPITAPAVVVFAGDHGVAKAGVSAYPTEVSLQMYANINAGGAGINAIGAISGCKVTAVDISLDHDATGPYRVRRACGNIAVEDAMTAEETQKAIEVGIQLANEQIDAGADLLIAGDLGIGNTTPAAAIIGTVCSAEPVVVVGRGTGIDDAGWKRKVAAVRDAMFRVRDIKHEPLALIQAISSPDLAAMAGFLAQAALRKTPVVLDGVVVTAAALLANKLAPGARKWWVAGHQSAEPAHELALKQLNLTPLLQLGMRLGEGSGAAAAVPLVQQATNILCAMATFGDAGVSTNE